MTEIIVAIIGGFSASIPTLLKIHKDNKLKKDEQKKELDEIKKSLYELDKSTCKNFLVRFLRDVERGETLDEVEKERAYETYTHYTEILDGNGYIKKKWNKVMK
ncbi:MAG: hypothetical protein HFH45_01390 [Bacilli bacterium]|nr:hypothetical protein [Bacilli bacterium]